MEPGETEHQAVVREIAEETGLAVRVLRLAGRVRRPAPGGRVYDIGDYLCEVAGPTGDPADDTAGDPAGDPAGDTAGDPAGTAPDPVAGDDADDARWVDAAEYARLPVIAGLWEVLREWGALPPSWVD